MKLHELHTAIRAYIRMANGTNETLSPTVQEHMTITYTNLIKDLTARMVAGQKKYGGRLQDKNLHYELRQELLDSIHYNAAEKWDDSKIDSELDKIKNIH